MACIGPPGDYLSGVSNCSATGPNRDGSPPLRLHGYRAAGLQQALGHRAPSESAHHHDLWTI